MAKTILKTSEKSNFILNMTEEQYSKLASFGLLAACFATSVFTAIPEITDKAGYSLSASGLAVSGVICMILALIAIIKKYTGRKVLVPLIAFAGILLWGTVSLACSYDLNVSFYGFPQRGEGLLALIFYFCFFVTAASVRRKKALWTLLMGVVGIGLLNSVWALIQIFSGKLTFFAYYDISATVSTTAASGLSQSPIFLAMLLSLSLTAAVTGFVLNPGKKSRIFCLICGCIFSFVMIFTYSLVGICGIVLGIVAAAAAVFIGKAPKIRLLAVAAVVLSAMLAVVLASTVMAGSNKKYKLYDGYTLWSNDAFQRVNSSGNYNPNTVDIQNSLDVYAHLNYKTMDIIKKYPLAGTGPEQLVYPQLYTYGGFSPDSPVHEFADRNDGTFDKVYNEYLYTAATRGIPSAIALIIVILSVISICRRDVKQKRSPESICLLLLTVCGALIFLIGCSNITFSPIYWACAGAACARITEPKEKKTTGKKSRKA